MNYLTKCDVMGVSPSFYIGGRSEIKTAQGGVLSLLLMILCSATAWFFGSKLIFAELTSSTSSQHYKASPSPKINDDLDFTFYFGIQDYQARHVYRPDILNVTFHLQSINKDFSSSLIELSPHPCQEADFHSHAEIFKQSIDFKDTYCIKAEDTHKFTLNSTFGFDKFTFFRISVEPCTNTTSAANCAPQDEIDSFMDGFSFDFGFVNDVIDPTNFSSPAKKEFDDFFDVASRNYRKQITFFFKNVLVKSDLGWIFEDFEEKSYFNLSEIKQNFDLRPSKDCLVLMMRLDKEEEIITRRYYRLQDFLAQVGGVLKTLMFFGKMLYVPFCRNKMVALNQFTEDKTPNLVEISRMEGQVSRVSSIPRKKTPLYFSNLRLFSLSFIFWSSKQKDAFVKLKDKYCEAVDIKTYLSTVRKVEELYKRN